MPKDESQLTDGNTVINYGKSDVMNLRDTAGLPKR